MAEVLDYLVRLRGAREAAADADLVAAGQDRIAKANLRVKETSGIAATEFGRSVDRMKETARGVAGMALGGLAIFAGFEGIKSAVESTQQLAVSAASVSKVTGMNINTAAQWLAVAQAHGIATRTLTMSFRTLSTQAEGAIGGTKKAKEAFKALGISTDELKAHSGSMSDLMGLVADQFDKMPGGVQKTQVAAQLLGRGWQQLIPLLSEGSKGMEELRKTAASYGVTLGKDPLRNAQKLHEAEINLKLAQTGLQVFIAEKLAPAFITLFNKALDIYKALHHFLGPAIQDVTRWFKQHHDVVKVLIPTLKTLAGVIVAVLVTNKVLNFGKAFLGALGNIRTFVSGVAGALGTVLKWLGFLRDGETATMVTTAETSAAEATSVEASSAAMVTANSAARASFDLLSVGAAGAAAAVASVGTAVGILAGNAISGGQGITPGTGPNNPLPNSPGGSGANFNLPMLGNVHVGGPGGSILHSLGIGARGAVVTRPTLAVIGDKGPEKVTPLDRTPGSRPLGNDGGWNHGDVVINVGGQPLARIMRREMIKAMAANA